MKPNEKHIKNIYISCNQKRSPLKCILYYIKLYYIIMTSRLTTYPDVIITEFRWKQWLLQLSEICTEYPRDSINILPMIEACQGVFTWENQACEIIKIKLKDRLCRDFMWKRRKHWNIILNIKFDFLSTWVEWGIQILHVYLKYFCPKVSLIKKGEKMRVARSKRKKMDRTRNHKEHFQILKLKLSVPSSKLFFMSEISWDVPDTRKIPWCSRPNFDMNRIQLSTNSGISRLVCWEIKMHGKINMPIKIEQMNYVM